MNAAKRIIQDKPELAEFIIEKFCEAAKWRGDRAIEIPGNGMISGVIEKACDEAFEKFGACFEEYT